MSREKLKKILLCTAVLLLTFDAGLILGPRLTPAPKKTAHGATLTLQYEPPYVASARDGIYHDRECMYAPEKDDALYFSHFDTMDELGCIACSVCNPQPKRDWDEESRP